METEGAEASLSSLPPYPGTELGIMSFPTAPITSNSTSESEYHNRKPYCSILAPEEYRMNSYLAHNNMPTGTVGQVQTSERHFTEVQVQVQESYPPEQQTQVGTQERYPTQVQMQMPKRYHTETSKNIQMPEECFKESQKFAQVSSENQPKAHCVSKCYPNETDYYYEAPPSYSMGNNWRPKTMAECLSGMPGYSQPPADVVENKGFQKDDYEPKYTSLPENYPAGSTRYPSSLRDYPTEADEEYRFLTDGLQLGGYPANTDRGSGGAQTIVGGYPQTLCAGDLSMGTGGQSAGAERYPTWQSGDLRAEAGCYNVEFDAYLTDLEKSKYTPAYMAPPGYPALYPGVPNPPQQTAGNSMTWLQKQLQLQEKQRQQPQQQQQQQQQQQRPTATAVSGNQQSVPGCYTGAIIFAAFSFCCCNWIFGLIALRLATSARDRAAVNKKEARYLAIGSYVFSTLSVVSTIVVIAVIIALYSDGKILADANRNSIYTG